MLFYDVVKFVYHSLTLANLGVEDMGIYGVVGSIVSMFAVFSGGMGNAVQRFLTYEIGRDNGDPNKVFCSCLNVIFLLSGIIFILLEVGGLWFLHTKNKHTSGKYGCSPMGVSNISTHLYSQSYKYSL